MRVAVVQGGPSSEAAVSRASGEAVARALESAGHEVRRWELSPRLALELSSERVDVVFPVAHGAFGEDGCLQGMLEILGIPYVGCGVRASALAADKISTKLVYRAAELPVARERVVIEGEELGRSAAREALGDAMIVKPAEGGSTLGMSRILPSATEDDWRAALEQARRHCPRVLVEELVSGQEFTCGVLDLGQGPEPLPIVRVAAVASEWYDFESKYAVGGSQHQCPADLPPELTEQLQSAALRAHQALGARHLSRTDVIVREDGSFILLETNTLPGMTDVSLFPEAAAARGISFERLVDGLAVLAVRTPARLSPGAPELPGRTSPAG